jgi:hypothetical protein
LGLFTPPFDNQEVQESGSGGLMVVPDATGPLPEMRLAVAARKDGKLFILNREDIGLSNIPEAAISPLLPLAPLRLDPRPGPGFM